MKCKIIANRLQKYVSRDIDLLKRGPETGTTPLGMRTRANTVVENAKWCGAQKKDFGDQVCVLAGELADVDETVLLKYRKGSNLFEPFSVEVAEKWVKEANRKIANKIKQKSYVPAFTD